MNKKYMTIAVLVLIAHAGNAAQASSWWGSAQSSKPAKETNDELAARMLREIDSAPMATSENFKELNYLEPRDYSSQPMAIGTAKPTLANEVLNPIKPITNEDRHLRASRSANALEAEETGKKLMADQEKVQKQREKEQQELEKMATEEKLTHEHIKKAAEEKLTQEQEKATVQKLIDGGWLTSSLCYYIQEEGRTPQDKARRELGIDTYLQRLKNYTIATELMNEFRYENRDKLTLLMMAVEKVDIETVRKLLNCGMDINAQDDGGYTALARACRFNNYDRMAPGMDNIVELILKSGADTEISAHNGMTPLSLASEMDWDKLVKLLLTADADVNAPNSRDGYTALIEAAKHCKNKALVLLIAAGADVNMQGVSGDTALNLAVEGHASVADKAKTIELLCNAGADVNMQNKKGNTALHRAAKVGDLHTVKQLFNLRNDINVTQEIDVTLKNAENKTAADCATGPHAVEIKRVIAKYAEHIIRARTNVLKHGKILNEDTRKEIGTWL